MARVRANITALMVAFSVMSYFDRIIISIAGPEIIREFSISETEMGAVYSAFLFGYTLTMIPGGRWADRFGPRLVVTLTGLGAALWTGLTAAAGAGVWTLLLGVAGSFVAIRFLLGLATGPLYPSCARVYSNWIPLRLRARVHGYVAGGAGLGGAISPLLFSWLIAVAGWRMSFVWAAGATAALALLWLAYVRNMPAEHPALARRQIPSADVPERTRGNEVPNPPWLQLLRSRSLLLLTVAYFCVCYFEYIFFFWLYYYLGQIRGLPAEETGVATTIVFLAWAVMSPLGGWASDRLVARLGPKTGRRIIPVACLALSGACLCIGINLANPVAAVALLALSFGLAACSDGPFWAAAVDIGGPHAGACCGFLNAGGNVGGVAPLVTPWIANRTSWSAGLYFAVLVLYSGVGVWFLIDPSKPLDSPRAAGARAST
ncbi:MAG: MFS transporter [Bryobacterales bacterium]|nr:MFS transporter [Bryobacterales bacterium]